MPFESERLVFSTTQTKGITMNNVREELEVKIKKAINRSISHNESVRLDVDGEGVDALAAIYAIEECEVDYLMANCEGIDTLDVWGFDPASTQGEMIWRLDIRFTGHKE